MARRAGTRRTRRRWRWGKGRRGKLRLASLLRIGLPLVTGLGLLAFVVIAVLPRFAPIELPNLAEPSRIYGRSHRIAVGQNVQTSRLLERLRRLGYRQVETNALEPGEFHIGDGRLFIHRRAFRTPAASGSARRVELRLSRVGRIQRMREPGGAPVPSLVLEPDVIGELHSPLREYRDSVRLDEIPAALVNAILTMEDRRFFDHGGLDLRRVVGAMLANLRFGGVVQGGSTLTQQLVKNVYLDARRTLGRKLHEAWLALRVEAGQSKQAILEAYLNTIYLGQRGSVSVRGVEAAARHYFGKSVRELSLGECAMIAGLVRGPGLYSPYRDLEVARERRDRVLEIMLEAGTIESEEYEAAVAEPLQALVEPPRPVSAPYFSAWVEHELHQALPDADLERAGLSVVTGLDATLQLIAEEAVERGLWRLEADFPALAKRSEPIQAALVAIDPATGDILALVGGRDYRQSQFDRATQMARQPGSVFKPIVALAALAPDDHGNPPRFTLASQLADEPLSVDTPDGVWKPTNYDGKFRGPVSLRQAIEKSLNVPMARLALAVGPDHVVEVARRMGVTSRLEPVPSLALGAFEMTPLEVARAYSVFASGGVRADPRVYQRALDAEGKILDDRPALTEPVFTPAEAALVTSVLRGTVERGTAAGLRRLGFEGPLAAKTGTTNDYRDAWFVGYTKNLVAVVWVGFDDGSNMGVPSSRSALPIFADFVIQALGPQGGEEFPRPSGIEVAEVDPVTGLLAARGCSGAAEVFLAGTAPTKSCRTQLVRARREQSRRESTRRDERAQVEPRTRRRSRRHRRPNSPVTDLVRGVVDLLEGIFGRPR